MIVTINNKNCTYDGPITKGKYYFIQFNDNQSFNYLNEKQTTDNIINNKDKIIKVSLLNIESTDKMYCMYLFDNECPNLNLIDYNYSINSSPIFIGINQLNDFDKSLINYLNTYKNINDFNVSKNAKDFDPFNTTNLNNFIIKNKNINNFEVFSLI